MACAAEGNTVIKDAAELRVKESDRILTVANNLRALGADVDELDDGLVIYGGKPLTGGIIESYMDHRIAMSFAVGSLIANGETDIRNAECVNISYPGFYEDLEKLKH